MQRIRDFLSVAWPTVTEACAGPFESVTWLAALQVVTARCGGDPARMAALGLEEFTALVRGAVPGWGGKKGWGRICRRVFAALTDTEGVVTWSRRGLLRRVADELGDLPRTRAQLRAVEADMVMVLGELGLSRLGDIPGLTAVGAAAILAETGDPRRYDSSSSLVKHAGLSPSENASGAFEGQAHISRRGRPGLRLTAWRAVWPMLQFNPVMAAKYAAMTQAADAARLMPGRSRPGGSSRGPRAARQGPRRVRRVLAALDLLHGRPRHQLGRRGRLRRRLPAGGRLTSASIRPHRCGCPLTFLPDEGESEPAYTLRTSLGPNPGQLSPVARSFSPARLNAVGAGPAASAARAEPACTTWSEKTRVAGTPNRAGEGRPSRHGTSSCPRSGPPARSAAKPGHPGTSRSKNPTSQAAHDDTSKLSRNA